jgi:hypothetical protein
MPKIDSTNFHVEQMNPEFRVGPVQVGLDGSLIVRLSSDEAERLIHALPFNYPLAGKIREALRSSASISPPMIVY